MLRTWLALLIAAVFAAVAVAQGPSQDEKPGEKSAREAKLEKENAQLHKENADLRARQAVSPEERAKSVAVFKKVYADAPRLVEAEACLSEKGRTFSVLVMDNKVGTICEVKVR